MPYRSSSSPADIGLSKAEYEDAVNLEKLYFLANKNDRCANCGRGGVSAVDVSRYEFLCPSCCSGKSSVKKIGEDRFSSFEVNKLHAKFDREGSRKTRASASPVGRSAFSSGGGGRRSERRGDRRSNRKPPVPDFSDDSESDSADDVPPPRRSRSMPRAASSRTPRHHTQRTQLDPFDDFDASSTTSWGGGGSAPSTSWAGDFSTNRSTTGSAMGIPSSPAGMMRLGGMQQHNPSQMGMMGVGVNPVAGMAGNNMVGMPPPPQQGWNPNAAMAAAAAGGLPTAATAGMGMLGASTPAGMLATRQQQQQYQQALLQQFAAAASRGTGGPMLGNMNPVGGVSPGMQMGGTGAMQFGARPPPFPGAVQQQSAGTNPFLSMQQHPQRGGGVAMGQPQSMGNPFLSMQQPQVCAAGGTFGALGVGVAGGLPSGFQQQCMGRGGMLIGGGQQLGSMAGPMGAAGGGALQASNPFLSMGGMPAQAQRPMATMNSTNSGGPMTGNPYNTSIW